MRYLANEHDSLRIRGEDTNRSRWELHPLWLDVIAQIETFPAQGVYGDIDENAVIGEQLARLAVSVYGYQKRAAALLGLRAGRSDISLADAETHVRRLIYRIHEPVTWQADVEAKRREARYGGGQALNAMDDVPPGEPCNGSVRVDLIFGQDFEPDQLSTGEVDVLGSRLSELMGELLQMAYENNYPE